MRGNTVSIRGNCTKDMEVRRTNSGNNACSWGIAWNSSRKNQQGGYDDVPHYFDVECWASDAQLRFLDGIRKGARCAIVDGHLEYQSWERDGVRKSKVVIRVDDPIGGLLVSQGGSVSQPTSQTPQSQYSDASIYDTSDIPW